jgi:predicted esterase
MNLPETACISIQGPQGLLDLGGFHWGDDIIFDSSNGGLDPDAGFKQSTTLLKGVVQDVLIQKCGYKMREIMVFGFGQGGMAGLNLAGSQISYYCYELVANCLQLPSNNHPQTLLQQN